MKYLAKDDDGMGENMFAAKIQNGETPATLPGSIEISKTGLKVRHGPIR